MGSLMAGWDSSPKSIRLDRNKSMTNEDIATYWKSKKNQEEVHGVVTSSHTFSQDDQNNVAEKIYERSNSLPITKVSSIVEEDEEKLLEKRGWWINSKWAFLNEPPVTAMETPFRYVSQFHVAGKHIDNGNHQSVTT